MSCDYLVCLTTPQVLRSYRRYQYMWCRTLCVSVLSVAVLTITQASTARAACKEGQLLTKKEIRRLIDSIRISSAGQKLYIEFKEKYPLKNQLKIYWDNVSYSELIKNSRTGKTQVCIHLAQKLPQIEHIADFVHELTHATKLDPKILNGEVSDVNVFVHERLGADGGEADAFALECQVKYELLNRWDDFCAPYVSKSLNQVDRNQVLNDLYSGELSASLTGEPYPILLARQFRQKIQRQSP